MGNDWRIGYWPVEWLGDPAAFRALIGRGSKVVAANRAEGVAVPMLSSSSPKCAGDPEGG